MSRSHLNGTILITFALLGTAVLAGCAETGGPAPCTGTCDVKMENTAFVPEEIKIKVGSTVKWTNAESADVAHDVTAKDGSWQSDGGAGGMDKGESWPKKFDEAGTFNYYCTLHSTGSSGMIGKITVVA